MKDSTINSVFSRALICTACAIAAVSAAAGGQGEPSGCTQNIPTNRDPNLWASFVYCEDFEAQGAGDDWGGVGVRQVVSHASGHALEVIDASEQNYALAYSPHIAVAPNTTYVIYAWSRAESAPHEGGIRLFAYERESATAGTNLESYQLAFHALPNWSLRYKVIHTSASTTSLRLFFYPAAIGVENQSAAWLSEVKISAERTLQDASGDPVGATSNRIDVGEQLSADNFWLFIPTAPTYSPSNESLWQNRVIRQLFLGRLDISTLAIEVSDLYLDYPSGSGLLDTVVVDPDRGHRMISESILYRPILRGAIEVGSDRYYPRRIQDYAEQFRVAFMKTDASKYYNRMEELIDFLLYSRYQSDGSNAFHTQHYPNRGTNPLSWASGFDYLFDEGMAEVFWADLYGYAWQAHEPDHHINAHIASELVHGYEVTGNIAYLNAAEEFVRNQIPRYGFHTGIYDGDRYYWTEYNPSGADNPTFDSTDNVDALVARAVAKVGYYTNDSRLLNYAKGLLWHTAREFIQDEWFYYDGIENPIGHRLAYATDRAVVYPAVEAFAYLAKAGVQVERIAQVFESAVERYTTLDEPIYGSYSNPKFNLHDRRVLQAWKTFSTTPQVGQPVQIKSFVVINSDSVESDKLFFTEPIFEDFSTTTTVALRTVTPPVLAGDNWQNGSPRLRNVAPNFSHPVDFFVNHSFIKGDVLVFEYEWTPSDQAAINLANHPFVVCTSTFSDCNDPTPETTPVKDSAVVKPGTKVTSATFLNYPLQLFFDQ